MASDGCDAFSWKHPPEQVSWSPLSGTYPLPGNPKLVHFSLYLVNPFYCFLNQPNVMPRRQRKGIFKGTVLYLKMLSLKPRAINWQAVFFFAGRGLTF